MRYGIIGAMAAEVELLAARLENPQTTSVAGMDFISGTLAGADVVVVEGRVGKVNSAAATQILIDRFGIDSLIFTGVAGSLDPGIEVGDIVISTDLVQHDVDITAFGYEPGVLPGFHILAIEADADLRRRAREAAKRVCPEVAVHEGRIATGDQFIADSPRKQAIVDTFGAMCAEMEGAAVAQVAWLNEVPFVVIRAMSDKADGSASVSFDEFLPAAARRSALLTEAIVAGA